jgi:hypothetical protein
MKRIYSLTIAAGLALALSGCTGNNVSTPSGDKDGDGVANISDQCPNTKMGTKVSKDGCKIYTSILDIDVQKVCNVKANGIATVLETAKKYNPTAVKHQVEFMRFKVSNTKAIAAIEKTIKEGKTTVALLKKKKYALTSVEDATQRACTFAIGALQLEAESAKNWRDAVPGDGFKY